MFFIEIDDDSTLGPFATLNDAKTGFTSFAKSDQGFDRELVGHLDDYDAIVAAVSGGIPNLVRIHSSDDLNDDEIRALGFTNANDLADHLIENYYNLVVGENRDQIQDALADALRQRGLAA